MHIMSEAVTQQQGYDITKRSDITAIALDIEDEATILRSAVPVVEC